MSERTGHVHRIHEIADQIGLRFGVSIAERSRMVAEELLATGDDDAILATLADGCAKWLSKSFTDDRNRASRAGAALSLNGDNGSEADESIQQRLAFPIVVPGEAPKPLVHANHRLVIRALDAIREQRQGVDRTERYLSRFEAALRPWPTQTVGELLSSGRVSLHGLFGDEAKAS